MRDQLLSRLHDGELEPAEAEKLRAGLSALDGQKLAALAAVDAVLQNALTAEANAGKLDLWAELEAKLPIPARAPAPLLPFMRRRMVRVTALLSTLAAAAVLLLLLLPSSYPSNRCDIEELDVAGQNATVIGVLDEQGRKTTLIWFEHQETDEWESL